jgi:hypothetical protein
LPQQRRGQSSRTWTQECTSQYITHYSIHASIMIGLSEQ